MSNTYKIGTSTAQIILNVNIVTTSPAATQVTTLVVNSTDDPTPVASSTDATGNITGQAIGDTTSLTGKRLAVQTKIGLLGDDAAARAADANNVTGIYSLSGGDEGMKTFKNPMSDFEDPDVFLQLVVDFV